MRVSAAIAGLGIALLVLTGCAKNDAASAGTVAAAGQPATLPTPERQIADSFGHDFSAGDQPETPSYEVAIASAAADQARGLEACDQKPAAERKQCKDQVNAAWEVAAARAADSRGNSQ